MGLSNANFSNAYLFSQKRTSPIYSLSPFEKASEVIHLCAFWTDSIAPDYMFQLKKIVKNEGRVLIPFTGSLAEDEVEKLLHQIDKGEETHYVLTNGQSIHVWNVKGILHVSDQEKQDFEKNVASCDQSFLEDENYATHWLEVDDMYLYYVNHVGDASNFNYAFDKLVGAEFSKVYFSLMDNKRWVDSSRNVTYDYFIAEHELEKTIFMERWEYLSPWTQHHLAYSLVFYQKGLILHHKEKFHLLFSSFINYEMALLSELSDIYLRPLTIYMKEFPDLKEALNQIIERIYDQEKKKHLSSLFSFYGVGHTLEAFLIFLDEAKSLLFSIHQNFSKKFIQQEHLIVERVLEQQIKRVEAYKSRGLCEKVSKLSDLSKWFLSSIQSLEHKSDSEIKDETLKLSYIMLKMFSGSTENNILFPLTEEKAGKVFRQKDFFSELDDLLKAA